MAAGGALGSSQPRPPKLSSLRQDGMAPQYFRKRVVTYAHIVYNVVLEERVELFL